MSDPRQDQGERSRLRQYVQTLRRHKLLFTLTVVVSVAFSAWFALGAAPTYRSTATVWVDNGPAEGSSLATMAGAAAAAAHGFYAGLQGPADFEQSMLEQQLETPTFALAVANGSLLPHFLASGGSGGFSPLVLLQRNHGSPQEQSAESVATKVKSSPVGPQVLSLSYTGPTPAVARSVLASLITQMETAAPAYGTDYARQEQVFFQQSASYAAQAVASAQESLTDYIHAHGYVSAETDPTYAGLLKSLRTTKAAQANANAAVQSTQGTGPGMKATLHTIDPASLPSGPVVSPGHTALGLFGGLFVGFLLGFLAIYVATPDRRPWDAELSNAPWMSVSFGPRDRARRTRTGQRIGSGGGVA